MTIHYQHGEKFEGTRLTYMREAPRIKSSIRRAEFLCNCGNLIERSINDVRHLNIVSCGCYKTEQLVLKNTKHSHAVRDNQTGAYRSWQAMHQRVKADPHYQEIEICSDWYSFSDFYRDMGDRPEGMTIERLDGTKGYEPSNCVWADRLTQATNTVNTRFVTINNETHSINEWCRIMNIGYHVIKQRRRRGMTIEEAITTPLNTSKQGRKK